LSFSFIDNTNKYLKKQNLKEVIFINKNLPKWRNYEGLIKSSSKVKPDDLAEYYIEITDDLAFAQTYYPNSETTRYLNSIALKFHQLIYKNKREKKGVIKNFWKFDFPILIHKKRKYIIYSFIIFSIANLIGLVSSAEDTNFIRIILGDEYVNMTLENIRNNDPMAVYKNMNKVPMFLGITINNIKVSFFAFILGIFISVGTGWIIFSNGIMLGSFHYFMFEQGVLYKAVLAIWMHGTLEIFAIIVAGAAGLILGNSILFPETYSRLNSFKKGMADGLKIAIGLIPMFIIAGFIEGFITRYTNISNIFRIIFISANVLFIIWYFFLYPRRLAKNEFKN